MATLTRAEIESALTRLGELAHSQGIAVRLLIVGGAAMVLGFGARNSTRDVDVAILEPVDTLALRDLAQQIGVERGWPVGWLNDAAKGFLVGMSIGKVVFESTGIEAIIPGAEQLLAMKLCAWRDDLDIADATRLLTELHGGKDEIWSALEPFLMPGQELKAQYAFSDLWEVTHGRS